MDATARTSDVVPETLRRLAEQGEAEIARGEYDEVAPEDLGRYLNSLGRD